MPHNTKQLVCGSLLEVFEPDGKYPGTREHVKPHDLAIIDEMISSEYDPAVIVLTKEKLKALANALRDVLLSEFRGHSDEHDD